MGTGNILLARANPAMDQHPLNFTFCFSNVALSLKGLHHDDFAILGQFCAKIITKCLYLYTKCSCKTMRKISNEFYQGELTIIIWGVIFENIASKLEKIGPIFSSFNPCSSMPSAATDGRKQFQSNKIVFNNNARPLFLEVS